MHHHHCYNTNLINHHVEIGLGMTVCSQFNRLPKLKRQIVQKELAEILGVMDESQGADVAPLFL